MDVAISEEAREAMIAHLPLEVFPLLKGPRGKCH